MSRAGSALLVCVSVSIRDSKLPNVRSLVVMMLIIIMMIRDSLVGDDDADMIMIVMIRDSLVVAFI